ncbi:SDR family NAD(P)-dependent oxidoreductase [Pseudahrensia aquimaris]|uniref:SDR family NAD(P)-dependent oxidoreductase n=1 Tax=Pseudahrensia aquimaris TaxID=744461 RepID=A0ABW3FH49_9HYPH
MTWSPSKVVIVGASGGIGSAFVEAAQSRYGQAQIIPLSRSAGSLDYGDEGSICAAAEKIGAGVDLIIVATGLLHTPDFGPEKAMRYLEADNLAQTYLVNTIGPALVMKHFLPLMPRDDKSVFAALSARVGSISDNHIGGWYGYRSAKAALNQMIRTASIEHGRRWKESAVIGLHPGTVDTDLSKPFQSNVAEGKLFTADFAAEKMLDVIDGVGASATGKVFAWDGQEVPA